MPRRAKGPRLWLRKARKNRDGFKRKSQWFILDGSRHIATGCSTDQAELAARKLAEYIGAKYEPSRKERDIEDILIGDVLYVYLDDRVPQQARPDSARDRVARLNEFWGGKRLSEVNGKTCRAYVTWSGSTGGSRRDLEDLRAAINHHSKEGLHRGIVRVTLPAKGLPRDRWLTRDEAAALIWACWRSRETQPEFHGAYRGLKFKTKKKTAQHVARFILIALYTGTRAAAVAAASPFKTDGRAYVDLEQGMFLQARPRQACHQQTSTTCSAAASVAGAHAALVRQRHSKNSLRRVER